MLNRTKRAINRYIKQYGRWILMFCLILAIIDYLDLSLLVGYGVFSRQLKSNFIEGVSTLFLTLTLYFSLKSTKESQRQSLLALRPYLRISWESSFIGENRRREGVSDTCLIVTNSGKGLMRNVQYSIAANNKAVVVKNHSLIDAGASTYIVYDDKLNKVGELVGCANDKDKETFNIDVIKNTKITVKGHYRDIEGGRYMFSFITDPAEQSWFSEKYRQEMVNSGDIF